MLSKATAVASFFMGFAVGAYLESAPRHWLMILGIVAAGLAGVAWLTVFLIWGGTRVWSGRESWWAIASSDDDFRVQDAISMDRRRIWRSPQPQRKGDFFEVDFGKARLLKGVYVFPDHSEIEKPKAWRIVLFGKDGIAPLAHKDGQGIIGVDCSPLLQWPVQRFRIEIKEVAAQMRPASNYAKKYGEWPHWAISRIRVTGYRIKIRNRGFFLYEL